MVHISMNGVDANQIGDTLKKLKPREVAAPLQSLTPLHNALTKLANNQAELSLSTPNEDSSFTIIRAKGDPYELYQNDPELKAKAKILAERLDGSIHETNRNHFFYHGTMQDFLRGGLLTDPQLFDLTASLSDEALEDFAQTIRALSLPATENFTSHNEAQRSYQEKVAQFTQVLLNSSKEERNAILAQSARYAEQVDKDHLAAFQRTVLSQNISQFNMLQRYRDDTSANNLHNYVSATIESDNPAALTEQLGKMSGNAQTSLLNVYGLDNELGERLSTLIGVEGNNIPESLLTALSDIIGEIQVPEFELKDFGVALTGDEALLKDNRESRGRDFALDAVTSIVSMVEQYDFSDTQLENMGSDLNMRSNPEKRAYIEITTIGLNALLQSNGSNQASKSDFEQALSVISELRENKEVVSLVNRAEYHDVTLIERPYIEEGLTVVALEGAAVFKSSDSAINNAHVSIGATTDKVNMENGHSVKGDESKNLYSAKSFDDYKADVSGLVGTLVAFADMRKDSSASDKMTLKEFTETLTDMNSGIRDELTKRVSQQVNSAEFREKVTENTQFAFFSSLLLQMSFETQRDFGISLPNTETKNVKSLKY